MTESKKYRCLIVDDETLAQNLIEQHVGKIPQFEVVGKCYTAIEAMQVLNTETVDILFLDIEMPDLTGIEFLKSLNNPPLTVLTTAYSEYALEGYEHNVVDYLLKPIAFDRFFKAASKLLGILGADTSLSGESPQIEKDNFIYVKSEYRLIKIDLDEIRFVEGMQKYVRFHMADKKVMTLMGIGKVEEMLPKEKFFRVHKSYLINLKRVDSIVGNMIMIEGAEVPISKAIKPTLLERIGGQGLA